MYWIKVERRFVESRIRVILVDCRAYQVEILGMPYFFRFFEYPLLYIGDFVFKNGNIPLGHWSFNKASVLFFYSFSWVLLPC